MIPRAELISARWEVSTRAEGILHRNLQQDASVMVARRNGQRHLPGNCPGLLPCDRRETNPRADGEPQHAACSLHVLDSFCYAAPSTHLHSTRAGIRALIHSQRLRSDARIRATGTSTNRRAVRASSCYAAREHSARTICKQREHKNTGNLDEWKFLGQI